MTTRPTRSSTARAASSTSAVVQLLNVVNSSLTCSVSSSMAHELLYVGGDEVSAGGQAAHPRVGLQLVGSRSERQTGMPIVCRIRSSVVADARPEETRS